MFYILADDLSGALEAGAAFRSQGWEVVLPLRDDDRVPAKDDVVTVISTETRNATAADAERTLRNVIARQRTAGGRLILKKIDSTLRGPLGAELAAIVRELAPPLIVVCPANPRVGRVVRDGVLHVDGVPLEQTAFRHDPMWPATTGDIESVLGHQGIKSTVRLPGTELRASEAVLRKRLEGDGGARIAIVDAATMNDLRDIVARISAAVPHAVYVGSGALGIALAESLPPAVPETAVLPRVRSIVVICGSRHPASHTQLDDLRENLGWTVIDVDAHDREASAVVGHAVGELSQRGRVALRFGHRGPGGPDVSREILRTAREVVRAIVTLASPDALFLTGGETAREVCRVLGGDELMVLGEAEPGVAIARLQTGANSLIVITKPGGFGGPATITDTIGKLLK